MKKVTFATLVSGALAALAVGLAGPASGANPYTPLRNQPVRPVRRMGPALNHRNFEKTCRPNSFGRPRPFNTRCRECG